MPLRAVPDVMQFLAGSIAFSFLFCLSLRLAFWWAFRDSGNGVGRGVLLKSFYLGLRFDLRLVLLLHLPIVLLGWTDSLAPAPAPPGGAIWLGYLCAATSLMLVLYFIDFGYYGYLEDRLDATAVRFAFNLMTSLRMVWESYPVVKCGALLLALIGAYAAGVHWMISRGPEFSGPQPGLLPKSIAAGAGLLAYGLGIYGSLSHYPLRWSEAFFSGNSFASALALNPVLYFFDTLKNSRSTCDPEAVRARYGLIAGYLGVAEPDSAGLGFARRHEPAPVLRPKRLNVIVVFLESFAFYKTSMSGNPLDPTPHIRALSENSLLFPRCYAPHGGTARSIFAAVTGLPDVEHIKTSSRNPLVVRQHTIINAFTGYEKFYFLGGSANWGEIRGLLSNNIPGLRIYEEGSYASPRVNTWGISDLHLFEEAGRVLQGRGETPFFAIIQTSGNHRPYTIPRDSRGFAPRGTSDADAVAYGFESAQAVESIRFMDHSVRFFLDSARAGGYYDNTLFVFLGDHGSGRRHPGHMPPAEDALKLTKYRVPLLVHAPGLEGLRGVRDIVASEVDLMPTIAALLAVPHVNTTLGRDLLDTRFDSQRYAFTIQHQRVPDLGLVDSRYYFRIRADGADARLHDCLSGQPGADVADRHPDIVGRMMPLCLGLHDAARYLRFHNKPEGLS